MEIGILQTGHFADALRDRLGDYDDMFRDLLAPHGFTFRTWNVVDMEFPGTVTDADGWLITGSRHGVYEDHPFLPPLEQFIRDAHDAAVPMVGVCFGHQVIAKALGGEVVKFPGGWSVGRQLYDWGGEAVALNAWHQDQVVRRPDGADPVATSAFCENAALVYGDRAFTIQAHPEFGREAIAGLVEHRSQTVPGELTARAVEALEMETDNARLGAMMARFFTERRI